MWRGQTASATPFDAPMRGRVAMALFVLGKQMGSCRRQKSVVEVVMHRPGAITQRHVLCMAACGAPWPRNFEPNHVHSCWTHVVR